MKAVWNKLVIAGSDKTIVVENNHFFPRESVNNILLSFTEKHTTSPWKGVASYYDLEVVGK